MTKTRDVSALQEEANELLYQSSDLTANECHHLLVLWDQLPQAALTNFIYKNEALLLSKLAGGAKVSLEGKFTPWNKEDMDAYYIMHPSDDATNINLYERRKILKEGFPLTMHDDLQLSRMQDLDSESARVFKQLELLAHARAIIDPKRSYEQHYINYLAALLMNYRVELKSACAAQKAAVEPFKYILAVEPVIGGFAFPRESFSYHVLQYRPDITTKIDWIGRYIAEYANRIISAQQTNAYSEDLKIIFKQLGELKQEVFPWLSVMACDQVFKLYRAQEPKHVKQKNINQYIDNFVAFHALFNEGSSAEFQLKTLGTNFARVIKQFLQNELAIAEGVCLKSLDKTHINIKHYLKQSQVSPRVMLEIRECLSYAKTPAAALLVYLMMERIQRDPAKYKEAYHYIPNFNRDDNNPAIKVAMLKQHSFNQAVTVALESGFLPPTASLFYAMLEGNPEHCKKMMSDLAEKHPDVLHETLLHIFSDDTYEDDHVKLLESSIHPNVDHAHYPLFALRRAYEQKNLSDDEACQLWVQFINSGIMIETEFFSKELNQQLFAKLEPVCKHLIHASVLSLPNMKVLASALAFYRATQLKMEFYKPCVIKIPFFSSASDVYYHQQSDWAEKCLSDLLTQVAYPNGATQINFDNIIRFLGVDFHYRTGQAISLEDLDEQIIQERDHFFALNQHINAELFYKFSHVFFQLHQKNKSADDTPVYAETLMREFPSLCVVLLYVLQIPNYVAIPDCFSISLRSCIKGAMLESQVKQQSLEQLRLLTPHFSMGAENTFSLNADIFRFLKQLYMAYCKQCVEKNYAGDWADILLRQNCKKSLQPQMESIHALLKTMKKELELHHKKVLQATGWFNIGYNIEESQTQLDHFKKIYNEMTKNDFSDLTTCRKVLQQVTKAVTNNYFKRSLWVGSFYHNYLVQLKMALLNLESKIIAFIQVEPSAHNQLKMNMLGSKYSLYTKRNSDKKDDEHKHLSYTP